jgi:hypothetical protein
LIVNNNGGLVVTRTVRELALGHVEPLFPLSLGETGEMVVLLSWMCGDWERRDMGGWVGGWVLFPLSLGEVERYGGEEMGGRMDGWMDGWMDECVPHKRLSIHLPVFLTVY